MSSRRVPKKPIKKETRGRKPTPESVRYMSLKRKGEKIGAIRLTFSADVVQKLMDLQKNGPWGSFIYMSDAERLRILRFQFGNLAAIGIPGLLVRVEPPNYDPQGYRVMPVKRAYINRKGKRVVHSGVRYYCEIRAHKLGMRDDIPAGAAELMWHDSEKDALHNGLYLMFPDEFMAPGAADTDNQDLTVRTRNRK